MHLALEQANKALQEDEIPIGAVLVKDDLVIDVAHNLTRQTKNPLAHAEKLIIDKILASKIKYLSEYQLYVTLEPCVMCAGLMVWSRLGTLIFGAYDRKAGAVGSVYNILKDKSFNHHPKVVTCVLVDECSMILSEFFRRKRL